MAEAKKATTARKPAAKKVEKKEEEIAPPQVVAPASTAPYDPNPMSPEEYIEQEIEAEKVRLEQDLAEIESVLSVEDNKLKGKTVQELRELHKLALEAEAEAKRLVHILRQRAANAMVDVDTRAEELVIAAKQELAKAGKWLRQIENALENEFKDISGIHKF
jgi:hypothetical protein